MHMKLSFKSLKSEMIFYQYPYIALWNSFKKKKNYKGVLHGFLILLASPSSSFKYLQLTGTLWELLLQQGAISCSIHPLYLQTYEADELCMQLYNTCLYT